MSLTWSLSHGSDVGTVSESSNGQVWLFLYPCSSNSDCSFYSVTLQPGTYLFELWGAQGGDSYYSNDKNHNYGAVGGYSRAAKAFEKETVLEFYLGGQGGLYEDISAGFNGGGKGVTTQSAGLYRFQKGAGGGGATDIRIKSGSTSTKVLVAGGGAGSLSWESRSGEYTSKGYGGGLEGGTGKTCLGGGQSQKN